jgi:hypothetical protein
MDYLKNKLAMISNVHNHEYGLNISYMNMNYCGLRNILSILHQEYEEFVNILSY